MDSRVSGIFHQADQFVCTLAAASATTATKYPSAATLSKVCDGLAHVACRLEMLWVACWTSTRRAAQLPCDTL